MKRRESIFPIFLLFLFLSLSIFFLSKVGGLDGPGSFIRSVIYPIEKTLYSLRPGNEKIKRLEEENKSLYKKIVDLQNLKKENAALRDQFETAYPKSLNLLPAKVVGAPGFIPGVLDPEYLIIDKGRDAKVEIGQAIVFKDNLVGEITEVSKNSSKVIILTNKNFSFTAKTSQTNAQGVIKGKEEEKIILENVLLSEELKVSDLVLTKGDVNKKGKSLPPDLVAGKIVSIDKKQSNLFQSAKIESLIDFKRLEMVFVVLNN